MPKVSKILLILFLIFLLVNLLYLDYLVLSKTKKEEETGKEAFKEWVGPDSKSGCGPCAAFLESVDEKIASAIATVSASIKKTNVSQKAATALSPSSSSGERSRTTIKVTSYLSLGTGSSTQKSDWTRVDGSEFTFDLEDYPGGKVFWEGNLRSQYTNSRCYARLFDKTNSRAVDFSEQSTDNTDNQYLTSQELAIWFGKLKYQLEIKSLNNITCYLDSPRLVVKY